MKVAFLYYRFESAAPATAASGCGDNIIKLREAYMKADVIIVGGGPAGIITALTAKSVYPEKSVCVIKDIGDGVIPCAIPYMLLS